MRLLPWIRSRILLKDRLNLRKSLQLEMPQSRLMLLLHKSLLLPLEARRRTIRFNNAACDDISLPTHRRFYLNGLFYTTRKWNHFSLRLIQIAFPSISNTSLLRCLSTNYVTFVSFWFLYFLQFCVYFLFPLVAHYGFFFLIITVELSFSQFDTSMHLPMSSWHRLIATQFPLENIPPLSPPPKLDSFWVWKSVCIILGYRKWRHC